MCWTIFNLLEDDRFNHRAEVEAGVLEQEASQLLSDFFQTLRNKKQQRK